MDERLTGQGFEEISQTESQTDLNGLSEVQTKPELNPEEFSSKPKPSDKPLTRAELARELGVSGAAIGKIVRSIEVYHDRDKLYTRDNRLTPFAQKEIKRYRAVGTSAYRDEFESSFSQQNGNLTVFSSSEVTVPHFEVDVSSIEPEELLTLLSTAQQRAAAIAAQSESSIQRENFDRLQSTLNRVERENAKARGYKLAAELDRAEQEGRLQYLQEQLGKLLGK